jgi:hypothetical protein
MHGRTRGALGAALTMMLALGAAQAASAASWPMFGGGPGRSSVALGEPSTGALPSSWTVTDAPNQGVYTTPLITRGARPLVVYGTQSSSSNGRVHVRDLVTGIAVGPSNGTSVDEAPGDGDTMGGGNKASLSFVDTSAPGGAPGQAFIVYNDDDREGSGNDVAIAQFDLATGELVRDVPVPDTLHTRPPQPPGPNGTDVSSAPLLELDAAGNGYLVFRTGRPIYGPDPLNPAVAGPIVDREERIHVIPIANARSRGAVIDTAGARATPGFYATSRTSPTLVTLADPTNGGAPATYVAMGTSKASGFQEVRTFKLPTLEPGPSTDPSADRLSGWLQTVSTPSTPGGLRAGAPGSGVATTPYLLVATGAAGGTARAYKLVQQGSRLVVDRSTELPGEASPALATDALVGPGAPADGYVVVAASTNLYVLRAGDLGQVAKLSQTDLQRGCAAPCTPPPSAQTGFLSTSPVIASGRIYAVRDDGTQMVLDRETAQPVPAGAFTQAAGNAGSLFSRGQPAAGAGYVVFAGSRGVFAYRTPTAPVPPPLGSPASGIAAVVLGSGPTTGPVIEGRPVALPRAVVGLRRSFRPRISLQTRRTGTRTRIVRLRVTARRGWRVSVRCRGRGCPSASIIRQARSSNPLRLKRLERTFRQTATIEIRVTRARTVGTIVRYSLRPRQAPLRRELCLASGARTASRCAW